MSKVSKVLLAWKNRNSQIEKLASSLEQKYEWADYQIIGDKHKRPLYSHPVFFKLTPNIDDEYTLKSYSGKVKFKMAIKTDQYGRRITGFENGPSRNVNVLFFGCSITLGDGINDTETFASKFGDKVSNARTFNFGYSGSSPGTLLSNLLNSSDKYLEGIDRNLPTTAVLTLIDGHFDRTIGTSFELGNSYSPLKQVPSYFISDGALQADQNFFSDPFKLRHLNRLYGYTNFARFSFIEFPIIGDKHYRLMTAILKKIEVELKREFPNFRKLYIAYYMQNGRYLIPLKPYLRAANLEIVGNEYFNLSSLLQFHDEQPGDSHPSALAHDLMSELLKEQIQI